MRLLIEAFDSPSTMIIGESFGALLATVSRPDNAKARLILLVPMLESYRERIRPVPHGGRPEGAYEREAQFSVKTRTENATKLQALLASSTMQRRIEDVASISYFEPWQDADVGSLLSQKRMRALAIVGLRDRVTNVRGFEWTRFKANAGDYVELCLDPKLRHQNPPYPSRAWDCLDAAMKAVPERPAHTSHPRPR